MHNEETVQILHIILTSAVVELIWSIVRIGIWDCGWYWYIYDQ